MSTGKDICNYLKEIRRSIAKENDIALEIPECTFKGKCQGTCPQCESEVRFLENELAKKLSLGKMATVAGISLTLGYPVAAQTVDMPTPSTSQINGLGQSSVNNNDTIRITGIVPAEQLVTHNLRGVIFDEKTREPIPFAIMRVMNSEGTLIKGTQTNMDGEFLFKDVPISDSLSVHIDCVGYKSKTLSIKVFKDHHWYSEIQLASSSTVIKDSLIVTGSLIETGFGDASETFEKDGIKVRVK